MTYSNPGLALGVLSNTYQFLPFSSNITSDLATDDAVSNNLSNGWLTIATGSWNSNNTPIGDWTTRRGAIHHANLFLSIVDKVAWNDDPALNMVFRERLRAEAYALRALNNYYLLRYYSGVSATGEYLGFPIVDQVQDANSDFNVPRASFKDCVEFIFSDIEKALKYLPDQYVDINSVDEIPQVYRDAFPEMTVAQYNRASGRVFRSRICGLPAKVVRAQTALLAASPAYQGANSGVDYAKAAEYAGEILMDKGGISGMSVDGHIWFSYDCSLLGAGTIPDEAIWRGGIGLGTGREQAYYPPSLFGNGSVNPTQNFVDAFSDVNGYPIDDAASVYDEANPYENRDPRLQLYVVVNGSTQGPAKTVINTAADGTTLDALNKEAGKSTRTGYYLRKLTNPAANLDPNGTVQVKSYSPHMRYTEQFLNYAEAANEAYGPTTAAPGCDFSAYDVIKAIRARAGVGLTNGDAYLESIKGDKDAMRELIRNERRLELSFENYRFWDLRRWKADLNEAAMGVSITGEAPYTFSELSVEVRDYKDYMYYIPIPNSEVQKWSALEQNMGW